MNFVSAVVRVPDLLPDAPTLAHLDNVALNGVAAVVHGGAPLDLKGVGAHLRHYHRAHGAVGYICGTQRFQGLET